LATRSDSPIRSASKARAVSSAATRTRSRI
jgi:hypothetical protein